MAVFLQALTAVVFRSEIALLLICHIAYLTCWPTRFPLRFLDWGLLTHSIFPAGLAGSLVGLALTIPIDTFFWQSPTYLWPELSAFLSNLFPSPGSLGASAWGTSPWHWYFSSALPRLLLVPPVYLFLWAIGSLNLPDARNTRQLLIPNATYIVLYSALAHKESRFIFPVLPPLSLAAAPALAYLWTHRRKSRLYQATVTLISALLLLAAVLSHALLLPLSALSYPGAHALNALHTSVSSTTYPNTTTAIHIHLDNLSTQTGITLFLQTPQSSSTPRLIFHKSPPPTPPIPLGWWGQFDYIIVEPDSQPGSWSLLATIHALGRPRVIRPNQHEDAPLQQGEKSRPNGIDSILTQLCGHWAGQASQRVRRVGRIATRGWWLDVDWVPRLAVLRREGVGGEEER